MAHKNQSVERSQEARIIKANQRASAAKSWRQLLRRDLKEADLEIRARKAGELWDASRGKMTQNGALSMAVEAGMADLLAPLMKIGARPNEAGLAGYPLHCAMSLKDEAEQREIVDILLAAGARMDTWMNQPLTAMMAALSHGSVSGVKMLASRGAALNPSDRGDEKERFITLPQWGDDQRLALALPAWSELGGDANLLDSYGNSLLTRAIVCNKPKTVSALLGCGASPERLEGSLFTPLALAAHLLPSSEIMTAVLDAGAKASERDSWGSSPLADELLFALAMSDETRSSYHGAIGRGWPRCEILLRYGARLSDPAPDRLGEGVTILQMALAITPAGSLGEETRAALKAMALASELRGLAPPPQKNAPSARSL